MTSRRTAIVGMNHPKHVDPRMCLYPDPPGCAGWNLWKLVEARTGATVTDYLRTFQRYNLVEKTNFSDVDAYHGWRRLEAGLLENFDCVVLLGEAVRRAAGLRLPSVYVSDTLICIPHPSGLNRWYNDPTNRAVVEILMEEVYTRAVGE